MSIQPVPAIPVRPPAGDVPMDTIRQRFKDVSKLAAEALAAKREMTRRKLFLDADKSLTK